MPQNVHLGGLPLRGGVVHVGVTHFLSLPPLHSDPPPVFLTVKAFLQAIHLGLFGCRHLKMVCTPPGLGCADMDGQAWWSHWLFQGHVDDQLMESSERGRGEDTPELKQPWAGVSTLS